MEDLGGKGLEMEGWRIGGVVGRGEERKELQV